MKTSSRTIQAQASIERARTSQPGIGERRSVYSNAAARIKDKSKTTVYLLTDTCPTCDEMSRRGLEQVQSLCRWSNRHGLHISLVAVMPGNTLWRPLYELLQLDMSDPAIPAYYHDGVWHKDPSGLVNPIQEEVTEWVSKRQ